MRHIYQNHFKDGNGRVVSGGTISVYLAGTTTVANVYAASSGGSAVNSVTSGTDGAFSFYVDDTEYSDQKFKIVLSATNYTTKTYADIAILPNQYLEKGVTVLAPSSAIDVIVWIAPYACTVTAVKGYRVGGTGATVNARRNGASNHLASALSLTSADAWMDGDTVQNTAYVVGDKLEIMVVSITGSPTQVAIQVNFRKA